MNVKRFTARTPREALALVRQAFGDDAVVLSTRPSPEGVEVLAMAPESLSQIEQVRSTRRRAAAAPAPVTEVQQDVEQLSMSTLSFQDYVRERMLKRRRAEIAQPAYLAPAAAPSAPPRRRAQRRPLHRWHRSRRSHRAATRPACRRCCAKRSATAMCRRWHRPPNSADHARREQTMLHELRQVRGLIEERFGALAFMEKLQRSPQRAGLTQKLLDCGFSPALIRKLVEGAARRLRRRSGLGRRRARAQPASRPSASRRSKTSAACSH